MKSGKKILSLLLTLFVLVLSLTALFACDDGVTVSFESNGGTSVNSITVAPGETVSEPNAPSRDGYTFTGWTKIDGTAWSFDTAVTENITLVATWERSSSANNATVSFDLKGGAFAEHPGSVTVVKGSVITVPETPTKSGYSFDGWFYLNEEFDFSSTVVAGDITLVARWTPIVYNISYELGGGVAENPSTYTVEASSTIADPTRAGYVFAGWTYAGAEAPTTSLVIAKGTTGDITLTANWIIINYTISYDYNGGVAPSSVISQYTAETASFTLAEPTRAHYDFVGWTFEGATEPVKALTLNFGSTGDLALKAVWKPHEYKIGYELSEGGVLNADSPVFTTVESEALTLKAPTRPGYKFLGWTWVGYEGAPVKDVTVPKGTAQELLYIAVWEPGTYTITYFENNGKTHSGEAFVTSFGLGDLPLTLPDIYLNNKCFISWYTDQNFENPISTITEYKDITVYAKFVDTTEGLEFTYNSVTGAYDVTGYTGKSAVVYIPEYYKNTPVGAIASGAFNNNDKISAVYLPLSITAIGEQAFFDCDLLENVYIDSDAKLTSIEKLAFAGSAIKEMYMPKALKEIGEQAFMTCIALKNVYFAEGSELVTIAASAFEGSGLLEITLPKTLSSIGSRAFYSNTLLKSVSFEKDSELLIILDNAFTACISLESIAIPKSVTSIGASAFESASSLLSLSFESGSALSYVGKAAFKNCDALTAVTIPAKLTALADSMFYSSSKLESVKFESESALTEIGDNAFYGCSAIKEITLPEKLATIGESAFAACSSLSEAQFASALKTIKSYAFNGCSALLSIALPKECAVADGAFRGCTAVKSLTINSPTLKAVFGGSLPTGLKTVTLLNEDTIEKDTFAGCNEIQSITLPFVGTSITTGGTLASIFGESVPASLKSVTVTGGTLISDGAFKNCTAIETVVLANTVNKIGSGAFEGCLSLATLELSFALSLDPENDYFTPEGEDAEKIFTKTFSYIFNKAIPTSLKSVTINTYKDEPNAILPEGALVGSYVNSVKLVGFAEISKAAFKDVSTLNAIDLSASELVAIGDEAFAGCKKLTGFIVGKTVTMIGNYAFMGSGITAIGFAPEAAISSIGSGAFMNCDDLTEFTVPAGVTALSDKLFLGCTSLTKVSVGDEVTSLGESAFEGCEKLSLVEISEASKISVIGKCVFKNSGIESFTVPYGTNSIPESAFEGCIALKSISFANAPAADDGEGDGNGAIAINDTLQPIPDYEIGKNAFKGSGLVSITLPKKVTAIQENAFEACTSLTSVSFEEGTAIKVIGASAFEGCLQLKSIAIPDAIVSIANRTFKGCANLESVSFTKDSKLASILASAFEGCSQLKSFTLPRSVDTIGEYAFAQCFALASIVIPGRYTETTGEGEEAVTVTKEATLTTIASNAFQNCDSLTEIALPATLTTLGSNAFYSCSALKKISFEEGAKLSVLASYVFRGCDKLEAFTVPDSITEISEGAFYGCSALKSVSFGKAPALESIGFSAFRNCVALESFTAPHSLKSVASSAFEACTALKSVKLTVNVQYIGNYAFRADPSLVITVVYFVENGDDEAVFNGYDTYWNTDSNEVVFELYVKPEEAPLETPAA